MIIRIDHKFQNHVTKTTCETLCDVIAGNLSATESRVFSSSSSSPLPAFLKVSTMFGRFHSENGNQNLPNAVSHPSRFGRHSVMYVYKLTFIQPHEMLVQQTEGQHTSFPGLFPYPLPACAVAIELPEADYSCLSNCTNHTHTHTHIRLICLITDGLVSFERSARA